MEKTLEHRKFLDDLFEAFRILGRGSYVVVCAKVSAIDL